MITAEYTGELLAIYMVSDWIQDIKPSKVLTASDSSNALISIGHKQLETRQDIIWERDFQIFKGV